MSGRCAPRAGSSLEGLLVVEAVGVTDSGDRSFPVLPRLSPPTIDSDAGRGLLLVDALAADWGTCPAGDGKSVWFSLDIEKRPSPA